MLERVTVTLEKELVKEIDFWAQGEGMNRSRAFATLLKEGLGETRLGTAVILAGGGEKRAEKAAERLPKLLGYLSKHGISKALIVVGAGGERVVQAVKDGSTHGLAAEYVWASDEGSAIALRAVEKKTAGTFLLCYSDVLLPDLDLKQLSTFHNKTQSACTVVLASSLQPKGFGVAKMEGARIVQFEEKPEKAGGTLVNAGFAVCSPSIFSLMEKCRSFERDALPRIAAAGKLAGYVYSGEWVH